MRKKKYVYMCIYIYIHTHTEVCIHMVFVEGMYVCMYVCMYACMQIYIAMTGALEIIITADVSESGRELEGRNVSLQTRCMYQVL